MDDALEERVDALERAVTDGNAADGLPDAARMEARLDDLETTVDDLEDRVAELDAAVQALRGFAGGVRAVDEAVERRANAAVARVERLEAELRSDEGRHADDGVAGDDAATDDRRKDPAATDDRGTEPAARSDAARPQAGHDDSRPAADEPGNRPPRPERGGATDERSASSLAETAAAAASERTGSLPTDEDGTDDRGGDRSSLAERIRRLL